MRNRYKVLPLSFPFNLPKEYWLSCVKTKDKIKPVFKRNGYYLDRQTKQTWLEIKGKAWKYSEYDHFIYQLETSEGNNWMEDRIFNALQLLMRESPGLVPKSLKHRFWREQSRRELRAVFRESRLNGFKLRKEIIEEVKQDKAKKAKAKKSRGKK